MSPNRVLFHLDIDAFFAAVEQLDDPGLRGKPVIVGGLTDRGVVATASYEARKFGVHSALATRIARRRCPQGIFVKPRMERYREISGGVFQLLRDYCDRIERVSVDEAYLDMTEKAEGWKAAGTLARRMKEDVRERFGLTVSIGVAPGKFVAKIASDLKKPDGLVVVEDGEVVSFLAPLPVSKIPGVGKVSDGRLKKAGVETIAQLAEMAPATLLHMFGKFGPRLHDFAHGRDPREVVLHREAKSVGSENTFEKDHLDAKPLLEALRKHADRVAGRLARAGLSAHTVTLKVKYSDFKTITRAHSLDPAVSSSEALFGTAADLLKETLVGKRAVRLIGIYASGLEKARAVETADFFGTNLQ